MQERIVAAYEAAPPLADLLGPVGVETLDDVAEYDWVTVGIYAFGLPPTKTRSGTPESSAHRALKEWAAAHPETVGASAGMTAVTERWFASGDESDVTFEGSDAATIVEVRPSEAEQHELRRAVFALVKLRAVMQAEDAVAGLSRDVSAVLVTPGGRINGRSLSWRWRWVCGSFGTARARNPALNGSLRGDLRAISTSPLPPRSGGRCRRQRGAPGAASPDSGSSPPSLRDTATGREGRRSRGTYAQVSSGGAIGKGSDAPEHVGWSGGSAGLLSSEDSLAGQASGWGPIDGGSAMRSRSPTSGCASSAASSCSDIRA